MLFSSWPQKVHNRLSPRRVGVTHDGRRKVHDLSKVSQKLLCRARAKKSGDQKVKPKTLGFPHLLKRNVFSDMIQVATKCWSDTDQSILCRVKWSSVFADVNSSSRNNKEVGFVCAHVMFDRYISYTLQNVCNAYTRISNMVGDATC